MWRLADATSVVPPLPERVLAVAVYGNGIVTAAGADIAAHELTPRNMASQVTTTAVDHLMS